MYEDLSEVLDWEAMRGHYHAKRMLEVAAAGLHTILLVGPSKSDKVVMARSLVTILPEATFLTPHPTLIRCQTDLTTDWISYRKPQ